MDLLRNDNELNLYDKSWKIYSRNPNYPPQYISKDAKVVSSQINEGCVIKGLVRNSILFHGVKVDEGAEIYDSVIMPGVHIKKDAVINRSIVLSNQEIGEGEAIGSSDGDILLYGEEDLGLFE
jgi:glucose-1-phosphate adenylyltransferase